MSEKAVHKIAGSVSFFEYLKNPKKSIYTTFCTGERANHEQHTSKDNEVTCKLCLAKMQEQQQEN